MGKEDVIKPMNIVNDNMSDTPETDAKWQKLCCSNLSWYYIAKNIKTHCQKKERERDEAREEVKLWQRERDEAITRRMETIMQCELYEQERDEAREQANYWKSQYELEKGLYVIELK